LNEEKKQNNDKIRFGFEGCKGLRRKNQKRL